MSRSFLHPTRRRLSAWLEHGDPDLDEHIDGCDRCAAKIEALSKPTPPIGDALRAMLEPPPDLQPRLRTGIARKLQAQSDAEFLLSFFNLPWSTAQAMSQPRHDD